MRLATCTALVVGASLLGLGAAAPARAQEGDPAAATGVAAPPDPGPHALSVPAAPPESPPPRLAGATQTVHVIRPLPLAVGGAILAVSYVLKIFGGLLFVAGSVDGGCRSCAWKAAGLAQVPIAGPLLFLSADDDSRDRSSTGWEIAGAWSAVEAAAVAMMVVGVVGHDIPVPAGRDASPSVTVVPTMTNHLRALSLQVSW